MEYIKINLLLILFYECLSLKSLPDLSKCNTANIFNLSNFYECSSLISLPDISKCNANNAAHFNCPLISFQNGIYLFYYLLYLESINYLENEENIRKEIESLSFLNKNYANILYLENLNNSF